MELGGHLAGIRRAGLGPEAGTSVPFRQHAAVLADGCVTPPPVGLEDELLDPLSRDRRVVTSDGLDRTADLTVVDRPAAVGRLFAVILVVGGGHLSLHHHGDRDPRPATRHPP